MKRVLLLGSSGFVGRNLTEYFSNKYELFTPSSSDLNILDGESVTRYIKSHSFDVVLNAIDRRINTKTMNGDSVYVVERLRMFQNLVRLNEYYGKMLYYGTGAEYGRTLPIQSISEEQFGRIVPEDAYGLLMYTLQMLALQKNNITNFRLFGIFGPHEIYQQRFISNAICKALCGYPITIRQNAVFDYLHTDDLCKMTEYYIEHDMMYLAYNATSGQRYELLELAHIVLNAVGSDVPVYVAKFGLNNEYTSSNKLLINESSCVLGSIDKHIQSLVGFYSKIIDKFDREALLYNL